MALSTIPFSGLGADASNQGVNFRNLIINGDMSVAQRGAGPSGAFASGQYIQGPDRFKIDISNMGNWKSSQSTDVPSGQGFNYSLKLDCDSADASPSAGDFIYLNQPIEGFNTASFKFGSSSAESLTLSFWVKSNKTGTYIVRFYDIDNQRVQSQSYTISSASTWEKKTITISGDTVSGPNFDNGYAFAVNWCLGAGTNYTSGTLNTSWNSKTDADQFVGQVNLADSTANEWFITGVQLEVGTSASDFEFLPYDVNLRRCQRYFQRYGEVSYAGITMGTVQASGGHLHTSFTHVTPMRTSPTTGQSNLVVTDRFSADYDVSSISTTHSSKNSSYIKFTSSGLNLAQGNNEAWMIVVKNGTTGYLQLDAEL